MGAQRNCFGIPVAYRGLVIQQGPDDQFFAVRERGDERLMEAPTWDELRDLIDEQTEPTFAGIPLSQHARSGVFGWHPGDDA